MRCLRPLLASLIVLALSACSPDRPETPPTGSVPGDEVVGTSAEIDNQVDLRSAAETDWRAAALQAPVRYADSVRTLADSRLVVALVDNARLTVGPKAQITIDRFLIDTRPGVAGAAVSVTRGVFRFASGRHGGAPDSVRFDTPIATIGIRGTILEGAVGPDALAIVANGPMMEVLRSDPSTATLVVLREGVIDVRIGQTVVVLDVPGQAMVLAGSRWSQPFMLSKDAGARLDALLAPKTNRPTTAGPPATRPPVVERPEPARDPDPAPAPVTDVSPEADTPTVPAGPGLTRPDLRRPQLSRPGGAAAAEASPATDRPPPTPIRPGDRRVAPASRLPVLPELPIAAPPATPTAPERAPAPAPSTATPPVDQPPPPRPPPQRTSTGR